MALEDRSRRLQALILQKTRQSSQSTTSISLLSVGTNQQARQTPSLSLLTADSESDLELQVRAA